MPHTHKVMKALSTPGHYSVTMIKNSDEQSKTKSNSREKENNTLAVPGAVLCC